jgi:hypothetical protein
MNFDSIPKFPQYQFEDITYNLMNHKVILSSDPEFNNPNFVRFMYSWKVNDDKSITGNKVGEKLEYQENIFMVTLFQIPVKPEISISLLKQFKSDIVLWYPHLTNKNFKKNLNLYGDFVIPANRYFYTFEYYIFRGIRGIIIKSDFNGQIFENKIELLLDTIKIFIPKIDINLNFLNAQLIQDLYKLYEDSPYLFSKGYDENKYNRLPESFGSSIPINPSVYPKTEVEDSIAKIFKNPQIALTKILETLKHKSLNLTTGLYIQSTSKTFYFFIIPYFPRDLNNMINFIYQDNDYKLEGYRFAVPKKIGLISDPKIFELFTKLFEYVITNLSSVSQLFEDPLMVDFSKLTLH